MAQRPRLGLQQRLQRSKLPMFHCCHVQFRCGNKLSREDPGSPEVEKHFLNKTSKVRGKRPKLMDWNTSELKGSIQRTRLSDRWQIGRRCWHCQHYYRPASRICKNPTSQWKGSKSPPLREQKIRRGKSQKERPSWM